MKSNMDKLFGLLFFNKTYQDYHKYMDKYREGFERIDICRDKTLPLW